MSFFIILIFDEIRVIITLLTFFAETQLFYSLITVTNEDFLSEDLSALHLRRLSILYNVDEIRQLVGYLYLPYTEWDDLFRLETEPQLLKFKALCLCHEKSTLTFRKIRKAVEKGQIQNPHTLCQVNIFHTTV